MKVYVLQSNSAIWKGSQATIGSQKHQSIKAGTSFKKQRSIDRKAGMFCSRFTGLMVFVIRAF